MLRTINQNRQLHALVNKLGINKETKEELVYEYTKGRSSSSADLNLDECQALINNLNHMARNSVQVKPTPKPKLEKSAENKMRRKILSICHEMRWKEGNNLDWKRINGWLLKYGYLHKPLNDYTAKELPTLITQFEQLLKEFYAKR